jgi:hypothetical protein
MAEGDAIKKAEEEQKAAIKAAGKSSCQDFAHKHTMCVHGTVVGCWDIYWTFSTPNPYPMSPM